MNIDLNKFVANDNATGYTSQNPKIQIVGSHAIFRPDSSDVSNNYTVRAVDLADPSLFVDLVIPVSVLHPNKLVVGPVYDLFTKFTGKTPIKGMKVYLGSEPSNNVLTDANGMATLKTWKAGKDSVFVVGATLADTAFYFWHNPNLNIKSGDNTIKAYLAHTSDRLDPSGIPTWHRFRDDNNEDLFDYIFNLSYITSKGFNPRWPDDSIYHSTMDNWIPDSTNKIIMTTCLNRNKDPTGGAQADSAWVGIKQIEERINKEMGFERIKYVETADTINAKFDLKYDGFTVGYTTLKEGDLDPKGDPINHPINLFNNRQEVQIRGHQMP